MEVGLGAQSLTISSFSAVFSATQARKDFLDHFRQSSGDKGMMGQQQKVARE